jgi:hypothetical protein
MRERPILFSGPMVRALLAGTKTQTRRIIKPQPPASTGYLINEDPEGKGHLCVSDLGESGEFHAGVDPWRRCPYGQPGDRLWVKEGFLRSRDIGERHMYLDDPGVEAAEEHTSCQLPWRRMSPLYMPRWFSRLTLEVVEVRAERLQSMTPDDARAECGGVVGSFTALWDSINAKRGYPWASNPWVWALTLRRLP